MPFGCSPAQRIYNLYEANTLPEAKAAVISLSVHSSNGNLPPLLALPQAATLALSRCLLKCRMDLKGLESGHLGVHT